MARLIRYRAALRVYRTFNPSIGGIHDVVLFRLQIGYLGKAGGHDVAVDHVIQLMKIDSLFAQSIVANIKLHAFSFQRIYFLLDCGAGEILHVLAPTPCNADLARFRYHFFLHQLYPHLGIGRVDILRRKQAVFYV